MRSPFAAGFGPGGPRTLYLLGALAAVKALGLLGIAEALAHGIAALFDGGAGWRDALILGLGGALARTAAAWLGQWLATRASLGAKESIRAELTDRMLESGHRDVGEATALATRGLDDLDPYYRTVLPAAMGAAIIPLALGLRILSVDWLSALIVVLTVPLIPVFMILIGQHTRSEVDAAAGSLTRLSSHLVGLARGLPVLVGLGRVEEQSSALHAISEQYRARTLKTLRTAFLSALALELIATLSVAVVAVTVGIRLLGGGITLEVGLLVLILAPECYTPLREVGVAFHAAQDGVAALDRVKAILGGKPARPAPDAPAATAAVTVQALTVAYAGRAEPAVDSLDFTIAEGETVALTGASGGGKSTVLAALSGRLDEDATLAGRIGIAGPIAWLPQHPKTIGDTVRAELEIYGPGSTAIDGLLAEFGLSRAADADPATLSPGELRRVGFVRALLRVDAGARVLLLDEPTAHLDARSSRLVEKRIRALAGRITIVLVSHDPRVVALADRAIPVSGAARQVVVPDSQTVDSGTSPAAAPTIATGASGSEVDVAGFRLLAGLLRPVSGRLLAAVLLGALAALSAAALTAVSGWLIVRAAQEPAIMYLLVAIVGVRFFGLARSILRYAERLVTHDAVFGSVTTLRNRLWAGVARRGTASPALRRSGTAFDLLVVTADQVRDLAPRVLLPPLVAIVTAIASGIAVTMLHPDAVPAYLLAFLLCLVVAPLVAVLADRHASASTLTLRSTVARRLAALIEAADDLRGNGVDASVRQRLLELDREAGERTRRSSWALGLGSALVVGTLTVTSVLMLAVCAPAVTAGTLPAEIVAVLALLPLGLVDPMLSSLESAQQWPALRSALARLAPVLAESPRPARSGGSPVVSVDRIEVQGLAARWPEADGPAFEGLTATATRGDWLAVTGPSGSGKSTLLSVLLRYLEPSAGRYSIDGRDVADLDDDALRSRLAWCPQEAHLFSSTVRGNLLLGRSRDDRPSDDELYDALRRAGLDHLVAGMGAGLDTMIGDGGSSLSGGERQRLAVARTLLSRADVVLLDEPTAHLDAPTAAEMMSDLRSALVDRTVVLVTHRSDDLRPTDREIRLGRAADTVAAI